MTTPALRARSAFEIIDVSIHLFRQHFATFVMLGAVAVVPVWIVVWNSPLFGLASQMQGNPIASIETPGLPVHFGTVGVLFAGAYLWSFLVGCAFVVAASDAYLLGTVDAVRAIRVALTNVLPLIIAVILWILACILGFIVFFVGLFYVVARYFAVVPAILLEDNGPIEAFDRSRDLSKNSKLRILGTLALTFLLFLIVVGTLQTVVRLLPVSLTAQLLLNGVVGLFVQPVITIVLTMLYYDQRIRKEGFDMEMSAQRLTPAPAAG